MGLDSAAIAEEGGDEEEEEASSPRYGFCGVRIEGHDPLVRSQSLFEPPLPGLFGYGGAACSTVSAGGGGGCTPEQSQAWHDKFNFNIMDKVRVPQDLAAGEYVLSFRWDCEQTPQAWTQCSDITVTA